jgi:hypothetical protein
MPFLLQATVDDHVLTATFENAKEVFAKAVEWHVIGRFININIDDGTKSYSIDEFSSMMALGEIGNIVETDLVAEQLKTERRLD